jgi:hypothetical protein
MRADESEFCADEGGGLVLESLITYLTGEWPTAFY